eukprot:TRINITY_DN103817_c0_g1_i1.p1 TRINITY_DN103817_c0_g1~~TRINITY_DN103817_c0_g1_i1.p1  ORF type:complete len:360 (+),score=32.27 TRINITY_DN103817_c0_g1_i1:126-1205(+)
MTVSEAPLGSSVHERRRYSMEIQRNTTVQRFWSDPFCLADFRKDRLLPALPRLAVAFTIYCVGVYSNCVFQAWLQENMATYYDQWKGPKPLILKDAGHDILPKIDISKTNWCDLLGMFGGSFTLFRLGIMPGPMSMRWTFCCRFCVLTGIMLGMRGLTIVSTVLPNPDQDCKVQDPYGHLKYPFTFAFDIFRGEAVTCADVLFSGHTVGVTLSCMFLSEYMPLAPWWVSASSHNGALSAGRTTMQVIIVVYAAISYACIIASQFHYSADVLLGFLLTFFVFKEYHARVRQCYISKRWYSRFLRWFEGNSRDAVLWHKLARKELQAAEAQLAESLSRGDSQEAVMLEAAAEEGMISQIVS